MSDLFNTRFNWTADDEDEGDVIDELARTEKLREEARLARIEKQRTEQLENALNANSNEDEGNTEESQDEDDFETSVSDEDADGESGADETAQTNASEETELSDNEDTSETEEDSVSEVQEAPKPAPPKPARTKTEKPALKKTAPVKPEKVIQKPAAVNSRARGDVVQIRDFPASIATHIQNMFPGKPAMGKALAAYILATSDIDLSGAEDIPKDVRDLSRGIKSSQKNATVTDLYTRIANIDSENSRMTQTLRDIELAVAYIIFDRAGFRQESAPSPSDIDMLEDGVMDLVDRMRAQGKQSKNEDKIRHGRTIR